MRHYDFKTTWELDASIDKVWSLLPDVEKWPDFWKELKDIETITPFKKWNCIIRYLFYSLHFTAEVESISIYESILLQISGDLQGTGKFTLSKKGEGTQVIFDWNVSTAKKWMIVVAPVTQPFFTHGHNSVMNSFAKGMARKLNARVINLVHA